MLEFLCTLVRVQLAAMAILVLVLVQGIASAAAPRAQTGCALAEADRAWLNDGLAAWSYVAREKLKIGSVPPPIVVMFDRRCTYSRLPGAGSGGDWSALPHAGIVRLPSGQTLPVAPIAYAHFTPENGLTFLVMSMPEIWSTVIAHPPFGMETSLQSVMIHELTHTRHLPVLAPLFQSIQRRGGISAATDDDSLQQAYKGNAAYVADFESERDILFRAAAAPEVAESRRLACGGLAKMRTRHARYLIGANAKWALLDDYYLTLEGVAEWARYSWLTDRRGRSMDPASVLAGKGSGSWSQDEGLALFLVIDRLVPGWQHLVFSRRPELAKTLLERACG